MSDGGRREAPVADEAPDRVAGVARQAVEARRPSRVAALLLRPFDAAEVPQGLLPRRVGRQATRLQALGLAIDVLLQFLAQLRLAPAAKQQRGRPGAEDVPEPHVVTSVPARG